MGLQILQQVYEQAGVAILLSNIGLNPTSASLFVAAALHIILSLTLLVVANIVNLGTVLNATISTAVPAASSWHLE
ncbi:monosaccharide-sensing protein 3-like [Pyrus communis]|uniref:monosaccharide-sensing protein 3-like n=1 Tax=Pyrus communis TaxID=23211 RepID=UPI0035C1CE6D